MSTHTHTMLTKHHSLLFLINQASFSYPFFFIIEILLFLYQLTEEMDNLVRNNLHVEMKPKIQTEAHAVDIQSNKFAKCFDDDGRLKRTGDNN